jgi:hypothetical protein
MAAECPNVARAALQTWVTMFRKRGWPDDRIAEAAGIDTEQLERYLAGADKTPLEVAERLRVALAFSVAPSPEAAIEMLSETP